MDWSDTHFWLAFGLLGNAAFFARFLVQWVASERARRSYVPLAFWHLSIVGSVILLIYALHRRDPIFTLAYLPNGVVYVRNLMLIRRDERAVSPPIGPTEV
jgi:lipid-A-disaccharide synthase-like uncharacterized protein